MSAVENIVRREARRLGLAVSEEELEAAARGLKGLLKSFPRKPITWYERAVARFLMGVEEISPRHWLVRGIAELGDRKPYYNVVWTGDRYVCDCYSSRYGRGREKMVCTHVAAVIIYRNVKGKDTLGRCRSTE